MHNLHFVCVSPHKTGSTWLYQNLYPHPRIWLPPKKELWYLNQLEQPYLYRWHNYFQGTGMPGDNLKYFITFLKNALANKQDIVGNLRNLHWWLKFLMMPYSMQNYHRLFPNNSSLISGDITPNYYFLPTQVIEAFANHNPNTYVIMIVRNPIERAWSYAKMTVSSRFQKHIDAISESEWMTHLDEIHYWWKPYPERIQTWSKNFHRFHLAFYDSLCTNPELFLASICMFLETVTFHNADIICRIINQGYRSELSTTLYAHLYQQYRDEIIGVQRVVSSGEYTDKWLDTRPDESGSSSAHCVNIEDSVGGKLVG